MVQFVLKRAFLKNHICFELPEEAEAREAIVNEIKKCRNKYNDYVLVTLQPPKRPRTTGENSQNHHLNGHILQICNETGNDYDTVKNAVKMIAVEKMEYPYVDFHGVITPKKERECDVEECAKLIEAAHLLASDLEIILKE